ncbi:MAG: alpha/beta fold hydrolase [Panacagrimonas sp.]
MSTGNPEVGKRIRAGGIGTNYHDLGSGSPVLMIHGSGPGVSAWANWRLVMPALSKARRVIAPDMLGFGYTDRPASLRYNLDTWVAHAIGLLDALKIEQADLVGNSFGGALSLAIAVRHPKRVRRLVLMGSAGVDFELTPALDEVWGYTPSFEKMRRMMDLFAYDRSIVTDDLARMRYEASLQPGLQEAYAAMFPEPRQRSIEALCSPVHKLRELPHETLIIHGREDQVIPQSNALKLSHWIPNSQLHIFGKCGHWTQIEHSGRFARLVCDFLDEAG